ncbi:GDYXXLXY domain-containing protein [Granulosicoccus sp. 3-233]|uniref:GDYXXLXY domain-containing protein n=1 Tax=Granulosicoccus sp. 3-233 TaxID=3417969 RepID=UPI003D32B8AA
MRSTLIAACIAAQAFVLGYMVYEREAVIAHGTSVSIATAPIDPRDPFRGDFVRLRYGLNSLDHAPVRWTPADTVPRKGDRIYAVLQARPGGLHDVAYFTNVEPDPAADNLFLRGRLRTDSPGIGLNRVDVGYGIEQLFVEQGHGIEIEQRQGLRGGLQTALHARISVNAYGTAVLTGYDWNALAIGIEIADDFALNRNIPADADPATGTGPDNNNNSDSNAASAPLTLTVVNQSDQTVTLNNPGENCGFHLEPMNHVTSGYREPDGVCSGLAAEPLTLAPGDSLVIPVDLAEPRWQMSLLLNGETVTADVRSFRNNGEWFRLVYRSLDTSGVQSDSPPGKAMKATDFWQGELVSQAFNALGQLD